MVHYADVSDAELVARARAGCDVAFASLYARYGMLVEHVVRRYARVEADVPDLCQQVWMNAWRGLPHVREGLALRGWLRSIAQNCGRRALQKHCRTREVQPSGDAVDRVPGPVADVITRIDITRACEQLPAGMGRMLLLFASGYTHVEIAREYGVDPITSRAQVCKARKKLQELLATRP